MSDSTLDRTRWSPITENDRAGILWIATILAAIYAFLATGVRAYIKWKLFGLDDWICLLAQLLGIGSIAAIFTGLSDGLGKSYVHGPELQGIGEAVLASRITLIFALALSKCSIIFLIKRLFSQDMLHHLMLCNIMLLSTVLWLLGSIIGVSISCSSRGLVDANAGSCSRQDLRWKLIGIFDAVTEMLLVALSCGLVWRLHMKLELKLRVILAFLFRLPLVVLAGHHIYYISKMPSRSLNLHIVSPLAIEQAQLGYAIISATIPNLKSFIMSFDTAMMMDISYKLNGSTKSRSTFHRPDSSMPSSKADTHSRKSSQKTYRAFGYDTQEDLIRSLRPEQLLHRASVHHVDDAEAQITGLPSESERESQDGGTIRRDMQWTVEETYHDRQAQASAAKRS